MKRNLLLESSKNTQCEKVVITGMGIISSIGKDLAEFEESLKAGRSGIGILNSSNKPSQSNIGASVSDFSFETKVKSHLQPEYNELLKGALNLGKRAPVSVKCSIASAVEAWIMARLHEKQVYGRRTGIIIAGSNLSCGYQYGLYKDFVDAPEYLSPTYAMYFMDTDHLAAVSQLLGIHGEGYTTGGASASGNVGIINGYRLIKNGIVDVCVVIGAMADLSPMEIQGFINIGALGGKKYWSKPESACRPFDIEHEGFIYGQAAACLVLESYNSALIRDVPVLAEIMGGAIVIDGNRKPDPNEEGEAAAMRHAIESAGLQKEDIDYINAHGSASPLGDSTEVGAIKSVFKECLSNIYVNSTKSLTGHCLFSAGVVEAVSTIIQLRGGFIHPNLNLDNPISTDICFAGRESINKESNIGMSNSFGFGGINSSIIIKKGV